MNDKIEEKAVILPPFKHMIMTIGELPSSYVETMTYYEMLVWFTNYLGKTVIPAINENGEAVIELQDLFVKLQNYVNDYFDNLDVQEEINNKLDDMADSGQLTDIIAQYLGLAGMFVFDTVEDMQEADNLVNGSKCQTLGYFSINDGGGACYRVTNSVDSSNHQEALANDLYATLILENEMNLTQFGIDHTSNDVTTKLNNALSLCSSKCVTLIIPPHTYNLKTLLSKATSSYSYSYFIELLENTKIKGISKDLSILKISDEVLSYTSVFFNDEEMKNIELDNFTIEQYYGSGNNMVLSNRSNIKCAVVMYGEVSNVKIKDIIFKNCCGVNTLSFNNSASSDITIENNTFDYYHVVGIDHYDRSIVYCECHDYLLTNNIVNGNFETLGGIECHGYNGRCENNIVNKCYTAIHIAPRFADSVQSANIIINNNILKDNAIGVKIWENTLQTSTIDCKGITITNNNIKTDGYVENQNFWLSVGPHRSEAITGITINEYTSNHKFSDIIIANNSLVLNDYSNYSQYVTTASGYCSGISIAGANDVSNVQIVNNHIEGWAGAGISTGSFNTAIVKNTDNVIITNNTILNVGNAAESQVVYKSPISLKYGVINNMIIRNNNILQTDNTYNTWVSIYNQTNANSTRTNLYCTDNIVYSVNSAQFAITSNSLKNIIIDRGATADRPINANTGDTYFDTGINKLIVYNGSAWTNADGSALT